VSSYDVAIVGGGPAGSTTASLLRKYRPDLSVAIFEREVFPRDHVGESQLPVISIILDEMGVWDKVEAANFPIKIGATYRWGKSPRPWDFEFIPSSEFVDEPRPAKFEGQRTRTAFQVDRAVYDKILLDHAEERGCEVHQGVKVREVLREGDRVEGLKLESGETITAKYYVDASGHSGIIRRAMGVEVTCPTSLQNVAIWEYFENADWAVEIGVGGTRVLVMSLEYGWIWFIPLGLTRTSVGLIIPAEYYKKSGKKPEELYRKALTEDPLIAKLMVNAKGEGNLQTTKDWSFLSDRVVGENWFLAGESAGFADPILAAGMSMAHAGGREVAYSIAELERAKLPAAWIKDQYTQRQKRRLENHIRFADYWYTANALFEDLQDFTKQVASDAGLDLSPDKAWAWLAQGGFIDEDLSIGTGGYSLTAVKCMGEFLTEVHHGSPLEENNIFRLNLDGAEYKERADYSNGTIKREPSYVRGEKVLPISGVFAFLVKILQREGRLPGIMHMIGEAAQKYGHDPKFRENILAWITQAMEAMIRDGWVLASFDPRYPKVPLNAGPTDTVHWNLDLPTVEPSAA
jgi:flavin-dependent dehydrogenase